jgi:hypothetical protein
MKPVIVKRMGIQDHTAVQISTRQKTAKGSSWWKKTATGNCKLCVRQRDSDVLPVCKRSYERLCNQLLINPIMRTRTRRIGGVYVTISISEREGGPDVLPVKFTNAEFCP